MKKINRTPAGEALTNLMLDLFRLSSRLLTVGDRLAAGLGLTSARWQILGAITDAERPQPVAWLQLVTLTEKGRRTFDLARDLGANRQNVQRIVHDLHKEGLVAFEVNPHHRRAQLVTLTEKGRRTFEDAMELQAPWVNGLSDGLSVKELETVHRVVTALRKKLGGGDEPDERG